MRLRWPPIIHARFPAALVVTFLPALFLNFSCRKGAPNTSFEGIVWQDMHNTHPHSRTLRLLASLFERLRQPVILRGFLGLAAVATVALWQLNQWGLLSALFEIGRAVNVIMGILAGLWALWLFENYRDLSSRVDELTRAVRSLSDVRLNAASDGLVRDRSEPLADLDSKARFAARRDIGAPAQFGTGYLSRLIGCSLFVTRFVGLCILSEAWTFLVYDFTKSVASKTMVVMTLGEFWYALKPASWVILVNRWPASSLWDQIAQTAFDLPIWLVSGALGIILTLLGRKQTRSISRPL